MNAQNAETVRWDTTRCMVGTGVTEDVDKLTKLLTEGWEPFAVTAGGSAGYVYHFRRPVRLGQICPSLQSTRRQPGGSPSFALDFDGSPDAG
jgi:hypothetical protein